MSKINLNNYSHTKIYYGKYQFFLGVLVSRQFGGVRVQVGGGKALKCLLLCVNFGVDKSVYLVLTDKELFPGGEAQGKSFE